MEEKILFFDIINGIAGDMTLATLLDLGIPKDIFLEEMNKLNISSEFEIIITQKKENGISGINVDVITKEENTNRHLEDILNIIDESKINEKVKSMSKEIFVNLAEAEAHVHKMTIDKVHFHEVGAIDSIVDIIGTCVLIDLLNVDKIYSTYVPMGSGFIECDHGIIPIPAPATIELLKGIPVRFNSIKGECTTPTGAAIIKVICSEFVENIEFKPEKIGYGIGKKSFEVPNMLRTIVGVKKKKK